MNREMRIIVIIISALVVLIALAMMFVLFFAVSDFEARPAEMIIHDYFYEE